MQKTVFSDSYINGLKPKDKTYRETKENGFYIRVTPQGKKAWLYRYYYAQKDRSITLGYYPAMSLGQAQAAYQTLVDLWQSGVDPKAHLVILDEAKTNTVQKLVLGWYEIDYQNSLWTIPKEHTKQDEVMWIHLTEPVKSMFRELQYGSKSDFTLSAKGGIPLSTKALSRAINRIQERVGIPHWTAHDLRRSFCRQLGETLHIDPVVIEKCLRSWLFIIEMKCLSTVKKH